MSVTSILLAMTISVLLHDRVDREDWQVDTQQTEAQHTTNKSAVSQHHVMSGPRILSYPRLLPAASLALPRVFGSDTAKTWNSVVLAELFP